ncbi:MAG TPA: hypothetical protein VHV81_11145 [Steroidobacteraceae bacterium]|jgi:hypothetical protein|nr:hypothetical protein [Steroidobacteraceae bacterium]
MPPVDLSFLNAADLPAGRHGFLAARGEALEFQDGTRPRLWGTNLTANALFSTPRDRVPLEARRLSALGFNLVRIHHHDSDWVDPNIFGGRGTHSTLQLSPAMLDELDWWIACLRARGIYIWLDLHVGRKVTASDGIDDFDEIRHGAPTAGLNGFDYVSPSIQHAMRVFNGQYLSHRNAYTHLRYSEDPAIAVVLITNEDDLTAHYGNALLPNQHVPKLNALYMGEAERFARKYDLPPGRVWRSWEAGPSKIFLNDLERRFDAAMIAHLRGLGVRVPIVTTSAWGNDPLSSLPALTTGDVIDAHAYAGNGELRKDPRSTPNLVQWIAAAHVSGKPLTVSEWGAEERGSPVADRGDIPIWVAAVGAMQGWDALLSFAYAYQPLTGERGEVSPFQQFDDATLLSVLPAAAVLYRQGHVAESRSVYVFEPGASDVFDRVISPATSVALRTASERGKLLIALPAVTQLPWLAASPVPAGATILRDSDRTLAPPQGSSIRADSGELEHDWGRGRFTIDTPRTQALVGRIGPDAITLSNIAITADADGSVIAVQSIDGSPLDRSDRIMITAGVAPSIAASVAPSAAPSVAPGIAPHAGTPWRLSIRARPGMKLHSRGPGGTERIRRLPYRNGRYEIEAGDARDYPALLLYGNK